MEKPSRSLKELEETNPSVQQARSDYKQWEESHARYLQQPPTGPTHGRTYIRHAQTLLAFLVPISEIHPIFKSVVGTFKTVLSYEDERGENDARVSCVFLAQSHMMEIILRMYHESEGAIDRDTRWMQDIVNQMEKEIRGCGNTIDSYYNCGRMVRFLRAMDWKTQFLQHVDNFNVIRGRLLDHLALSAAQEQRNMHKSLNKILTGLANPSRPWEQKVATLDKTPGREEWVVDYFKMRDVLLEMDKEDTSEDYRKLLLPTQDGEGSTKEQLLAQETLETARKDAQTTVAQICSKNAELFERKLDFLAARLQTAIDNSAKFIVQTLDGPHARLENEDLRKLWKEMKWIFCVDSRTFVNSLFEFYRDKFTAVANPKAQEGPNHSHEKAERRPIHPDAWTLEFLVGSDYIPIITTAFDQDNSGFVRITEANALTRLMPPNFSLAQWCAFEACGRVVEGRMYQLRIQRILLHMTEMQNKILPANIVLFADFFDDMVEIVHPIVDSVSFDYPDYIPPELEGLIKKKIVDQDEQLRNDLARLLFDLDGENTVRLIFGKDVPLERYLLRLLLAVLEHWTMIEELSTEHILDGREWKRIRETLMTIRDLLFSRINELIKKRSPEESANWLHEQHDSIYYLFYETFIKPVELRGEHFDDFDEGDYFEALTLIKAIPILGPQRSMRELLRYPTYAEYHEQLGIPMEADSVIGWAWGLSEEEQTKYAELEREIEHPPVHMHCCDTCDEYPIVGQAIYHCYQCEENDVFCSNCYRDGKHCNDPTHPLLRTTTFVPHPLHIWLSSLGVYKVAETLEYFNETDGHVTCNECKERIKEGEMFAQCVGDFEACPDYHRCANCLDDFQDETAGHKSWHHVMIIPEMRHDISEKLNEALYAEEEAGTGILTSEEVLSRKVVDMEDRLNTLEIKLDEGMKTLQTKMDTLLGYLEGKLGPAMQ